MSDDELDLIIRKSYQLRKLILARERVKQLERELYGEPIKPENVPHAPQFLRVQASER